MQRQSGRRMLCQQILGTTAIHLTPLATLKLCSRSTIERVIPFRDDSSGLRLEKVPDHYTVKFISNSMYLIGLSHKFPVTFDKKDVLL